MNKESRIKIMIVDDDKEFLEEVQEMLTLSGYDITVVPDGALALQMMPVVRPRIVLLDLKMTPKSGFQVASELRNTQHMKDTGIIAMTGFFTEKEHTFLMKLCGIRTCILKPIKPLDLIAKIEFELGEKSATPRDTISWN